MSGTSYQGSFGQMSGISCQGMVVKVPSVGVSIVQGSCQVDQLSWRPFFTRNSRLIDENFFLFFFCEKGSFRSRQISTPFISFPLMREKKSSVTSDLVKGTSYSFESSK